MDRPDRGLSCLGIHLDHLDSHHHTWYLSPRLLDLMLEMAQRYGCGIRPAVTEEAVPSHSR